MARSARTKRRASRKYRVFVSHASDDQWVAAQISRQIELCGAASFLDTRDIAAGDDFKSRIRNELPSCDELLALFTPWSKTRAWVRHEIGMADALQKRIVCVFYKVTLRDLRRNGDSLGPIEDLNIIDINALDAYFAELTRRVSPT